MNADFSDHTTPAQALAAQARESIPGYRLGDAALARSPLTLAELELLKATTLIGADDIHALHEAGKVLEPQIDAILDVWYGYVGSHAHLARYFANPADGKLNETYLARVRARFGQWIRDTTAASFDQAWLDYQHEFALRHTRAKKNTTDHVISEPHIHFRWMVAFIIPISITVEPFLRKGGSSEAQVLRMHRAWTKALVLQVALWSEAYVRQEDY
ncbi:MAG: protoglobin domain-containing protein [Steroidobacteraceae bacterium]